MVGQAPKPHDPWRARTTPGELRSQVESVLTRVPSTMKEELEQLAEAHELLTEALKD